MTGIAAGAFGALQRTVTHPGTATGANCANSSPPGQFSRYGVQRGKQFGWRRIGDFRSPERVEMRKNRRNLR